VLLIAAVVAWGDSDMLAGDLSQVRLAGEATIRSNVDNAYFRPFQEGPSVVGLLRAALHPNQSCFIC